jgi:predicted component of type VI protein secretion system
METLPRAAAAGGNPLAEHPMRAQLLPLDGGAAIELAKELTLVGRREDCDVRLDHKSVSKMHCVIVKTDGLLLLRDLGSTNGTRVNGQRVRRAALLPNDQVAVAGFKFRVTFGPENAAAAPDEHTQHLDAKDVANLLQPAPEAEEDSSLDIPAPPLHARPLPDVYPEDKKDQGK